ncbi:hypothetical protein F4818DRAFT_444919 [Hypoxylon cercidicola]|nr:hypothetical protein F4818DRAFT_444919 [Hypoxylon cercidicola]
MASETKPTATLALLGCQKCTKTFANQHALAVHQLKAGHLLCDLCGDSFHNIQSVSAHRTQVHHTPDKVMCPGCPKAFPTAGGWMQHVEKGECPSLFPSDVSGHAARVMGQLNKEWQAKAMVEYEPFSGESHIKDTWADWKDETDTARFDAQKQPNDFPSLASQGSHNGNPTKDGADHPAERPVNAWNAWSQKKDLFPEKRGQKAAPPPSSLVENMAKPTPSSRPSGERAFDPESPGFNAGAFFNPILEVFTCPHTMCNTKCKTSSALISHLKSPKHTAVEFRCPSCSAKFTTTSSWVQHAETVAVSKCRVRNTNQFARIMRDVSNGALDVKSINKVFEEKVKVKLSDDWVASKQASTDEFVPGSDQWVQSKQAETPKPKSKPGTIRDWS